MKREGGASRLFCVRHDFSRVPHSAAGAMAGERAQLEASLRSTNPVMHTILCRTSCWFRRNAAFTTHLPRSFDCLSFRFCRSPYALGVGVSARSRDGSRPIEVTVWHPEAAGVALELRLNISLPPRINASTS